MEDRFSTRSVPDLRGWLRHSPIMGAALIVAAIATYGLPGWVAFEARTDLARLATPDYAWVIVLAGLATLPTYVRLLLVGTGPATSRVRGAAPERFATRRRQETLPVTVEGEAVPATAASPAPTTGRAARPRAVAVSVGHAAGSVGHAAEHGVATAVRRDRTELIAAAVLALAILAGLTSWGALDLGGASSEAAPTAPGPSSD
jgi:formate hydrogenlyase subunit 3/multisubunit Na+/H+ antiporter MnhD subunit